MNRAILYFFIKITVSICLLGILYKKLGGSHIIEDFKQFSFYHICLSFISLWVSLIFASWRTRYILLNKENQFFSLKQSIKLGFIGVFLNQGLPGSIGGDFYKAYALKQQGFSMTSVIQSLLLDRAFGLFFLSLIGLIAFFYLPHFYIFDHQLILVLIVFLMCVFGFILFSISYKFKTTFKNEKIQKIANVIFEMSQSSFNLLKEKNVHFILASLACTFFLILPLHFLSQDLQLNECFFPLYFVMPFVFIVAVLPISFSGWGVREVAFVMILAKFNIPQDKALALSIAYGLVSLFSSLPGLVLWVFYDSKPKKA